MKYCGVTGDDEVPVGGDQFEFETWECLMRMRWGRILAATERDFAQEKDREVGAGRRGSVKTDQTGYQNHSACPDER